MFTQEFFDAGSTTRVTVTRDAAGWELREERDHAVTRQTHYTDWHRVERALKTLGLRLDLGEDVKLVPRT